jgi:hypothetical protein
MGIDAEDGGPGGHGPITVYENIVSTIYSQATGGTGVLVIGGGKLSSDNVTTFWNTISTGTGIPVAFVNGASIGTVSFSGKRMLAVVSDQVNTPSGGLTAAENTTLTGRQSDIATFVNNGGGLLGFTSDFGAGSYGYMAAQGSFTVITNQFYSNITPTPAGTAIGITDQLDVVAWHDVYQSFPSFLAVLATVNDSLQPLIDGKAAAIGGQKVVIPPGISLAPATAQNPAGTSHTVTATVTEQGQPKQGALVSFKVTAGPNSGQQSPPGCTVDPTCQTDANGQVSWTYLSNGQTGTDTIQACFTDSGGTVRCAEAKKTWVAGEPARLDLQPKTKINPVDTKHCVTATVTDAFGNPTPGVTVNFSVTGSVNTSGSATTGASGVAQFCYIGPALPGADTIKAYADTNNNNIQDPGEPSDVATKTWVNPVSTPLCEIKITNGGWIIASNSDRANLGGNAQADGAGNASGVEEYQDQGPAQPFNLHGNVLAIVCGVDGKSGTVFGDATIDGAGSHAYRIDVIDNGEPGTMDHYRMRVDAYDSGDQTLKGGNIQVHKS